MKRRVKAQIAALVVVLAAPVATWAADIGAAFHQGRSQFSLVVGSGTAFDQTYTVIGVGASYYVLDGLSLGLGVQSWSGKDPGITKVTPSITYVFHEVPSVKPYLGAFYRRNYIDGEENLDSYGGRAGIYFGSNRVIIGVGGVYEKYQDCQKSSNFDCDDTYAELSVLFTF